MNKAAWRIGFTLWLATVPSLGKAIAQTPTNSDLVQTVASYETQLAEAQQFFNQGTATGYQEAIARLQPALPLAQQAADNEAIVEIARLLGVSQLRLTQPQAALNSFEIALQAVEALENRQLQAQTLNDMGMVHYNLGNLQTALGYFEEALPLWREIGDGSGESISLASRGLVNEALGNFQAAIADYETALPLARDTENRYIEASTLDNLGKVHAKLGNRQRALAYYQAALALWEALGYQAGAAVTLNNIGLTQVELGNRQEAQGYYDRALAIWESVGNRAGYAVTLKNIGSLQNELGRREEALDYFDRTLAIQQEIGNRFGIAGTLSEIGSVYNFWGQPDTALDYYQQALALWQEVGNRQGIATELNNIGSAYGRLGQLQNAFDYLDRALALYEDLDDRLGLAAVHNNLGSAYREMGNYSEALAYYNRALSVWTATGSQRGEAIALNDIGAVYDKLGNYAEAIERYEAALDLWRGLGDGSGESTTLTNLGAVHRKTQNYEAALTAYNRALFLLQDIGDRDDLANLYSSFGSLYNVQNQYETARDYYERGLALWEGMENRAGIASTLNDLGTLFTHLGNPDAAIEHYNRALPLWEASGNRSGTAVTLSNRAGAYRNLGNLPQALADINAAIAIVEQLRGAITSSDLRTSYFSTFQGYYELKIELLMQLHRQQPDAGYDIQAFNTSERTRARTLIELLREANIDIHANVDPELRQRERELRQQLRLIDEQRVAQLQALEDSSDIEAIVAAANRRTEAVLQELDTLAMELRVTSPAYANLKYPQPLNLEAIQQQVLDEETTLLQYFLGEERSYVWRVTAEEFQVYELPPGAEVEAAANEFYRRLLRGGRVQTTAAYAKALSDVILAPLSDRLVGKRLLIVPDGALHHTPFSAIAVPNRDSYQPLITQYELVSAPSATTIATNRELMGDRPRAPGRLALLADPVFTPDDPRVTGIPAPETTDAELESTLRVFDLQKISRLPYTRTEAEQLLALLPENSAESVLDFEASYNWVSGDNLDRYQFVHFATHGFINYEYPELSGLVLSLVDADGQPQNGFLRLVDIFNLRLSADLVVLSACQTGIGENVDGEGVVGLTRGLMYAGAERTVLSLWDVDDKKTAMLMEKLYRGIWQADLTPAAALRQAQLEMWEAGVHPLFWAAFTLQGEWR